MTGDTHYLQKELYALVRNDASIFEFFQEGSLDGIWYWDLEQPEHEWLSPRFWTTLGYDPKDKKHLASEWQDLIHPEDLKTALDNFAKHCENPKHPYDQVVRYKHKSGSMIWIRCRGVAIRNGAGKPVRMLGAHTDITLQKQAEEALYQRTLDLEKANQDLQLALDNVKTLRGLLPICAHCKKIRDDKGYWNQLEAYFKDHANIVFSHGICPTCYETHYADLSDKKSPQ